MPAQKVHPKLTNCSRATATAVDLYKINMDAINPCSSLAEACHYRGQLISIDGLREVHLVTMSRGDLPDAPPEKIPQFATVRGYETASWSEGAVAMMLIGKVQRTELEAIFRPVVAWMPPARVLLASER